MKKRPIFWLLMVMLTGVAVEGLARLGASRMNLPVVDNVMTGMRDGPAPRPPHLTGLLVHPYAGYLHANPHEASLNLDSTSKVAFAVALTGGSVARQLSGPLARRLERRLTSLYGSDFRFDIYATAGHKQPQQLMQLAEAAALGKHYDLVINIDGYNEAFLPFADNLDRGVAGHYPRAWDVILGVQRGSWQSEDVEAAFYRMRQQETERSLETSPWARWGVFRLFAKRRANHYAEAALDAQARRLMNPPPAPTLEQTGPVDAYAHINAERHVVQVWRNANQTAAALVKAGGGHYVHFLQPNQYLRDAKPMGSAEQAIAFGGHPDRTERRSEVIGVVYPMMRAAGAAKERVDFVDLTQVFADEPAPVYKDPCCHFNAYGLEILAERIESELVDRASQIFPGEVGSRQGD